MVYNGNPYKNGWFGGTPPILGNPQIVYIFLQKVCVFGHEVSSFSFVFVGSEVCYQNRVWFFLQLAWIFSFSLHPVHSSYTLQKSNESLQTICRLVLVYWKRQISNNSDMNCHTSPWRRRPTIQAVRFGFWKALIMAIDGIESSFLIWNFQFKWFEIGETTSWLAGFCPSTMWFGYIFHLHLGSFVDIHIHTYIYIYIHMYIYTLNVCTHF